MAKNKYGGGGLVVAYSTDDVSYTDIGMIASADLPSEERNQISYDFTDNTHGCGSAGSYTSTTFSFEMLYDPENDSWVKTAMSNNTRYYWRFTFTDGTNSALSKCEGQILSAVPNNTGGGSELTRTVTVVKWSEITEADQP